MNDGRGADVAVLADQGPARGGHGVGAEDEIGGVGTEPARAAAGSGSSGGRPGLSALVGASGGPMLMVDMSCAA